MTEHFELAWLAYLATLGVVVLAGIGASAFVAGQMYERYDRKRKVIANDL